MSTDTTEKGMETIIVNYLRDINGYEEGRSDDYNQALGLDTARLEAFLCATQPKTVENSGIFSTPAKRKAFFERVRDRISKNGVLNVLNKGIQHNTHTFFLYYPFPDKANEEAKRMYAENRFCVTRQLHFSSKTPKESVDVMLSINGLPVITMELKNNLPQIICLQSVWIHWVSCSILGTQWVGRIFETFIERKKPGCGTPQFTAHHHFLIIYGKMDGATLRREEQFLGVAVMLVLKNCALHILY